VGAYRLTIREGPRLERSEHETLDDAITALEARMDELAKTTRRKPIEMKIRRFEPVQQVAARGQISGPGRLGRLRAGIDLRGDGSAEAFTGGWGRNLVLQEPGETAYDALRRTLVIRNDAKS
jgi:hypothetical protein